MFLLRGVFCVCFVFVFVVCVVVFCYLLGVVFFCFFFCVVCWLRVLFAFVGVLFCLWVVFFVLWCVCSFRTFLSLHKSLFSFSIGNIGLQNLFFSKHKKNLFFIPSFPVETTFSFIYYFKILFVYRLISKPKVIS